MENQLVKQELNWVPKPSTSLRSVLQASPESKIAVLRKSDMPRTVGAVSLLVSELVAAFNFGGNMSAQQIAVCAADIVEEFYYFSLDDIALCFRMARKGDLIPPDKLFRLDQSVVFQFLALYDKERVKEKRKLDQQKQDQNNIYDTLGSEPVLGIIKEVADKLSIKEAPEYEPRTRTTDAFSRMCHEEFDALWNDQQLSLGQVRIVSYQDKDMTITEYMGARLMEVTQGPDGE
jgi:hypothetical protein